MLKEKCYFHTENKTKLLLHLEKKTHTSVCKLLTHISCEKMQTKLSFYMESKVIPQEVPPWAVVCKVADDS